MSGKKLSGAQRRKRKLELEKEAYKSSKVLTLESRAIDIIRKGLETARDILITGSIFVTVVSGWKLGP